MSNELRTKNGSTMLLMVLTVLTATLALPAPKVFAGRRPPALDKFENLEGEHAARSMKQLDQDITLHPTDANGYIRRGAAWMLDGDFENAQRDFSQALKIDPHSAQAHIGLSRVATAERKWDVTFAELNRAQELGSPETILNVLNESAFLHRELKQYDIALKQYTTVLNAKALSQSKRCMALFQRGETFSRSGKNEAGLKDYNQALKLEPAMIEARIGRAIVYAKLNKLPESLADCTFVIEQERKKFPAQMAGGLQSHLSRMYKQRANVYERMGKHDLAVADLRSVQLYDRQTLDAMPFRPIPIEQR